MKKYVYISSEVGVPLLYFLWKWKLVSTAALAKVFFPKNTTPLSTYNWLRKLKRAGYLSLRTNERIQHFLWALDKTGFQAIRSYLPELREEGYASEAFEHDWLTTAFHLGDWLIQTPPGVETFSEQQLRRFEPEHYPTWVPKDQSRRPDGYWHRMTPKGCRTIALETELGRKKHACYQEIGHFYRENFQISRVLWVVRALSNAQTIEEQLIKGSDARTRIHSFVKMDSFLKHGWSAPIIHGAGKAMSVQSFLIYGLGLGEYEDRVNLEKGLMVSSLMETDKTGLIPVGSRILTPTDFRF